VSLVRAKTVQQRPLLPREVVKGSDTVRPAANSKLPRSTLIVMIMRLNLMNIRVCFTTIMKSTKVATFWSRWMQCWKVRFVAIKKHFLAKFVVSFRIN